MASNTGTCGPQSHRLLSYAACTIKDNGVKMCLFSLRIVEHDHYDILK